MQDILSPEEYAQLLNLGAQNQSADEMMKLQQAKAQQLRKGMDPLQTQMLGRVAVAPHWTQALGNVGKEFMAQGAENSVMGQAQQKGANNQSQLAIALRALLQGGTPSINPDAAGGGLRLPGMAAPNIFGGQ